MSSLPRPCLVPGCTALVKGAESRCPTHLTVARSRPPGSQKFYSSSRWQKIRASVRREQPVCQRCLKDNRVTPSQTVHHIDNDFRNNETANLEGLCNACHFSISGAEHNLRKNR